MLSRLLPVLAAVTLLATLAACGSSSDEASDPGSTSSAATSSVATSSAGTTTGAGAVSCSYPSSGTAARKVDTPPTTAAYSGTVKATLETSIGDLTMNLDADSAPCTVNSFASLATQGFYDDTSCPRLTTAESGISVLQCGDPTGTTTGGPGYSFADELNGDEHYGKGVVAMANAGTDTNGSQFFLVYADSSYLDGANAKYTIFGQLTARSVKAIAKAAKAGTTTGEADGTPKKTVEITGVTIG
ncbi:MAG: peptidylprolyl isomerase [Nocardioides sp.]|uniref:peptidylprolyl isomerase n=1 Tax=Nocardioides sp. TaxID=35761 RepID=UPI0039E583E7